MKNWKLTSFRQETLDYQGLREYAARKRVPLSDVLDAMIAPVVEAVRPRRKGEPPPVDPFPELGVPLDEHSAEGRESWEQNYRRRRRAGNRAA